MNFLDTVISKARSRKKTIVLPESEDIRTLQASSVILKREIANVILIGSYKKIQEMSCDIDLSKATIVDPTEFDSMDTYANALFSLRKHKGLSLEKAKELLLNPLYLGVMMVKLGDADGMVAGAIHATGDVLRPALQILKCAPHINVVSSCFLMAVPNCNLGEDGTFIFSDCALVENPTAEQLSEIALSAAQSCTSLIGKEPKVGMLSYSTNGSAHSEMTEKVQKATQLVKEKKTSLLVDGEIQLDAAIVPKVSDLKFPSSSLKGCANTLIFPDLNAANIGYKLVQRLANAQAYGPITQGLAKPVNDLSRGCSYEDIVGVVAITAVQAQG